MSETADALLAAALRRVPWAPAGLASTSDGAIARASALLSWARANPGQEAESIVDALRPTLLQLRASGEASGLPEVRALLALIPYHPGDTNQELEMAVYMIFYSDSVTDRDGINNYQAKAGPTLGPYAPIPRVVSEDITHVEGDWKPGRVVMLEFESREKALGWYNSPEYSAVKGLRLAATSGGGGVLVDAFKMPGQ